MNRGLGNVHMPMAVAVYLPVQYPRLLAIAADASDLEATWQEWHEVLQETKQQMAALGMHLIEVIVDLDALEKYCQEQGLENTSSTRAQYAAPRGVPLRSFCVKTFHSNGKRESIILPQMSYIDGKDLDIYISLCYTACAGSGQSA